MSKPLGKPDRIVVALGGNALGNNPVEQIQAVSNTAHALLGLIEQGNEIIITHGNGPQVGMIQNAFAAAHDAIGTPEMPLPECGAMSQGYIGYHLQQGIGREMHKRYKRWHAATVVTQIECDPDDPAFKNPTKPIGPFYTEEQAKEFMAEDPSKVFVEDSGRGWRRVVASPDPKKIVEADSILNLLDNEFIVIACGGGGIPVVRDYENKGCYKGVPAVIDKDLGGELLAEDCDADVLFLLTAVEHVAINFGKPNQEELEDITADEAHEIVVDSNYVQRVLTPSEKARSISQKYALAGRKKRSRNGVRKSKYEQIGEEYNLSARQIARYVQLGSLDGSLLKLLDGGKLPLTTALRLVDFSAENQKYLAAHHADELAGTKMAGLTAAMTPEQMDAALQAEPQTVRVSVTVPAALEEDFRRMAEEWLHTHR